MTLVCLKVVRALPEDEGEELAAIVSVLCLSLDVLINLFFPNPLVDCVSIGTQADWFWNHELLFVL
jgi:hypothetical protein